MNDSNSANILGQPQSGTWKGVFIVRDGDTGRPLFDDPNNVPQAILDALSEDDLTYLETLKEE